MGEKGRWERKKGGRGRQVEVEGGMVYLATGAGRAATGGGWACFTLPLLIMPSISRTL